MAGLINFLAGLGWGAAALAKWAASLWSAAWLKGSRCWSCPNNRGSCSHSPEPPCAAETSTLPKRLFGERSPSYGFVMSSNSIRQTGMGENSSGWKLWAVCGIAHKLVGWVSDGEWKLQGEMFGAGAAGVSLELGKLGETWIKVNSGQQRLFTDGIQEGTGWKTCQLLLCFTFSTLE